MYQNLNNFFSIEERKNQIKQLYKQSFVPYNLFKNNYQDNISFLSNINDKKLFKLFENDKRIGLNQTQCYVFKFLSSVKEPTFNHSCEIMSYIHISMDLLFKTLSYLEKQAYIKQEIIDNKVHYLCYNECGRVINKKE